jgi:hypothetical protein
MQREEGSLLKPMGRAHPFEEAQDIQQAGKNALPEFTSQELARTAAGGLA